MPEYPVNSILLRFHGEVTQDVWEEVSKDVKSPVSMPFYEELIYDAVNFYGFGIMRHDAAALYGYIAIELMLEDFCRRLLIDKKDMTSKEAKDKVAKCRRKNLVSLVRRLDPNFPIASETLKSVADLRDEIAHGDRLEVTAEQAHCVIRVAENLKEYLSSSRRFGAERPQ